MAYRKTAKVLAHLAARKALILGAAEDVIARHGLEGLDTARVAARANVAVGAVYKHFPDKHEIFAAIVARALARDVELIREAATRATRPNEMLGNGIRAWMDSLAAHHAVMVTLGANVDYRAVIRTEFARLIRATQPAESAPLLAAVAYGAIFEAVRAYPSRNETAIVGVALRAIGLSRQSIAVLA